MRDKNRAQVTKLGAILCALKCHFFVTKVIHNLVALLMYSERYWLINALSAQNPFGSVKGEWREDLLFLSLYIFTSPCCSKGIIFLLAEFKGQKPKFLPSNAFKRTLILISVSSITLKSLTRNCSYISLLFFPDLKRTCSSPSHLLESKDILAFWEDC